MLVFNRLVALKVLVIHTNSTILITNLTFIDILPDEKNIWDVL